MKDEESDLRMIGMKKVVGGGTSLSAGLNEG